MNYYNEFDPFAAEWLRELIKAGAIAPGEVDERSIVDVEAKELKNYKQCHFFAGIGTWSYALRCAGWPDTRPVWTGSPPCQPFSTAGKRKGKDDERHLAPHWLELVSECHPPIIFGEQVAAAIGHGWFDDLQTHLEAEDYACGMVVLPACSVGAPHIRQRQWFVAERMDNASSTRHQWAQQESESQARDKARMCLLSVGRTNSGLADTEPTRSQRRLSGWKDKKRENIDGCIGCDGTNSGLANTNSEPGQQITRGASGDETTDGGERRHQLEQDGNHGYSSDGENCGLADTQRNDGRANQPQWEAQRRAIDGGDSQRSGENGEPGPTNGFWRAADWLYCRDGKWRPVEPGTFPLAHGAANRVGRLRGYGNAIVPQVAQAIIESYLEMR